MRLITLVLMLLLSSLMVAAAEDNGTVTFIVAVDIDNDGVYEPGDTLIGDEDFLNETGFDDPIVLVNGSNVTGTFLGIQNVTIFDSTDPVMSFLFDFSSGVLYLSNITIIKDDYHVRIQTDQLQPGYTKIVYLEEADYVGLCARDTYSLDPISDGCNGTGEINFDACIGSSIKIGNISCDDSGVGVSFANMTHSAARGYVLDVVDDTTGSRRSAICDDVWYCSRWSGCENGIRHRSCQEIEVCNVVSVPFISHDAPILEKACQESSHCSDGIKNGDETDVDCGGECEGCNLGYLCLDDGDCGEGICINNFCSPALQCKTNADCASGDLCIDNICTTLYEVEFSGPSQINLISILLFIFTLILVFVIVLALISGHRRKKFI